MSTILALNALTLPVEHIWQVLIIGEEEYTPYMRPPLSKALWLEENHENARQLKFPASWAGGKLIESVLFF